MTLIIGMEDPDNARAVVFADSGMWRGEFAAQLTTPKIWRDGDWIVGGSGHWADMRLIRAMHLPTLPTDATEQQEADALGDWSEALLKHVSGLHTLIKASQDGRTHDSPSVLVARGTRVWDIEDGAVARNTYGWEAIGIWPYAAGALSALMLTPQPRFLVGRAACFAVERITDAVRAPWIWLATDGTSGVL